jgi:NAD(P)-dependent dehydrogenase (short-subunit alcohol dehydrogenase family)
VARVFVTGSTTGLGLAAADAMIANGHDVILHARTPERADDIGPTASRAAGTSSVTSPTTTRRSASRGPSLRSARSTPSSTTPATTRSANGATPPTATPRLAVNVLAPYLLTALTDRPDRLIYLSSRMHSGGRAELDDLDWHTRRWNGTQAYSDSKLCVTALALAIARRWPDVSSNAVDPDWVPTRMGGPGAPDDLELGHTTQVWLATSNDPAATTSGGYWYHQHRRPPVGAAVDDGFQDQLVERLAAITGCPLP